MFNGALPSFDLAEGGLWLPLIRCLVVAGSFSVFGTLIFRQLVLSKLLAAGFSDRDRWFAPLMGWSLAALVTALIVWLGAEAGSLADATTLTAGLSAIPKVLFHTHFGIVTAAQIAAFSITALLVLTVLVPTGAKRSGTAMSWGAMSSATIGLGLQIGHSHAWAMTGSDGLLLSELIHLLAGGAWLGGLLPLILLIRGSSAERGSASCRYFADYAKYCVVLIAITAAIQAWSLTGGPLGLVATGYGWIALSKLVLYLVLLGFAYLNRYRLAPALLRAGRAADADKSRRALLNSLMAQSGVAFLVIFAAAILSSLPPSVHVQPIWPFTARFSLDTLDEDPSFRTEVLQGLLTIAGTGILAALGVLFRQFRWVAMLGAAIALWFAVPHLDILLVDAYPTSYYRSPTGFSTASIVDGHRLFLENCTACHGVDGRGDGPAAKSLPVPPADLTASHLWMHSDGELFWWLSHGIDGAEGSPVMPGFEKTLTGDSLWHLIDYIRAHNAGFHFAAQRQWDPPIQAPVFDYSCGDAAINSTANLRGTAIRLIFGDGRDLSAKDVAVEEGSPLMSIIVPEVPQSQDADVTAAKDHCVGVDPELTQAYGTVTGSPPQSLAGTQILIDPNGWMRAAQSGGTGTGLSGNWDDPRALADAVRQICTHPLASQSVSHAHHP